MAYDFLDVTNRLDDKDFMANNLINALYQFLGSEPLYKYINTDPILFLCTPNIFYTFLVCRLRLTCISDIHDDTGTLTSLTSLTFWPNQELSSGNFGMCAPGIIDVSVRMYISGVEKVL